MCPPDPQRAHHRQMQRLHLTPCLPGSSWPNVPCSWLPSPVTRVFSLGDFLRPIWPTWRGNPGALSTLMDMTPASLKSSHIDVLWPLARPTCAGLPRYKRMPPRSATLATRQRCSAALFSVAQNVPQLRHHMLAAAFANQPQQAAARMGLPGCWPVERQRRPDGWTSTPRACRRAAAKSTPGSLVCLWYGCLEDVIAGFVRGVLRHCVPLRPSCSLLRACLSAAAFDLVQQQAAARNSICWVFWPSARQRRPDGWTSSPRLAVDAQSSAPAFIDGLVDVGPFRDPGSWVGGCGCLLRIEAYCVLACSPVFPFLVIEINCAPVANHLSEGIYHVIDDSSSIRISPFLAESDRNPRPGE